MSLKQFVIDLDAQRDLFVAKLQGAGVTISSDATLKECIEALDAMESGDGEKTEYRVGIITNIADNSVIDICPIDHFDEQGDPVYSDSYIDQNNIMTFNSGRVIHEETVLSESYKLYKCVACGNTTWSGYELTRPIGSDDGFETATELTTDLPIKGLTPQPGHIYSHDTLFEVKWYPVRHSENPLTFTSVGGSTNVRIYRGQGNPVIDGIQYRMGSSELWQTYTLEQKISLTDGESVQFRNTNNLLNLADNHYCYFVMNSDSSGAYINASGNIMSMINFEKNCSPYCFKSLFYMCTILRTPPELPATTLSKACYKDMFNNVQLYNYPILPAMVMAEECYAGMFSNNTRNDYFVDAPILPATTLAKACYMSMFAYTKTLLEAPELPATTLAESCYERMFEQCNNLSTTPELPAEVCQTKCYYQMYYATNITSIVIKAKTLANWSCYRMLRDCYYLNSITVEFENWYTGDDGSHDATEDWVYAVQSEGTFVKPVTLPTVVDGTKRIPENWTVEGVGNQLTPTDPEDESGGNDITIEEG